MLFCRTFWIQLSSPLDSEKGEPKAKRAPSKYMNFCKVTRPDIVKKNPDMTFGEVGKELGKQWRELSDAKKEDFK